MDKADRLQRQLRRKLTKAITAHDVDLFKQILTENAGPDQQQVDLDGTPGSLNAGSVTLCLTYLQYAVRIDCLEIANFLLDAGADINSTAGNGSTALYMACSINSIKYVKFLIGRGADIDTPDASGRTPFMKACVEHNLHMMRVLLVAKANTDYTDCDGNSALHLVLIAKVTTRSAADSLSKVVDLLARCGCDVNQVNRERMTPVMLTAQSGNTDAIQTLLLAGCDLDHRDRNHCTALYLAVKERHTNAVRLLLQNGADVTLTDYTKVSPLHVAVRNESLPILDVILATEQGLSTMDIADYEGTTPILHSVKQTCHIKDVDLHSLAGNITRKLLAKGCDVNVPHLASGRTPLFAAALTGNTAVAQLLLNRGADVGVTDKVGETVLHIAVGHGRHPAMISLLIQAGCDVNVRNNSGHTALYKSVAHRCPIEIIKKLIDAGSDLEAVDYMRNTTALHIVNYNEAALLLIDRGSNINHKDVMGTTPLTKAVQLGLSDIIKRLLSLPHCDVNAGTNSIALHTAVTRTEEHLINQLVILGADINKTDQQGLRPIQVAIEANQRRIITCLLRHGCSLDPTETSNLMVRKSCCYKYHDPHPHTELQPLFAAVKFDDFEMFKTLLSHYHRRPYRLLQIIHDMLTIAFDTGSRATQMISPDGRKQLLEFLRVELVTPPSLLELNRGKLRETLGVGVARKVPQLLIPASLKDYLLYETDSHLDLTDLNDVSEG